jgi:SAM-dependent methyltransferase
MAHPQQLQFVSTVTSFFQQDLRGRRVLEVGAYDVNGSVRGFFPDTEYIGVDLVKGPGVDVVMEGDKLNYPDCAFDISISCECFEHNPFWLETFQNMIRMTKPGGVILFTCATLGRPEHGTTRTSPEASPGTTAVNWDYYKNLTPADFESKLSFKDSFQAYSFFVNQIAADLYFIGVKRGSRPTFPLDFESLEETYKGDQEELQKMMQLKRSRQRFVPKIFRGLFSSFISGRPTSNPRLIRDY